jgi:hypothetical protein
MRFFLKEYRLINLAKPKEVLMINLCSNTSDNYILKGSSHLKIEKIKEESKGTSKMREIFFL